MAGALASALSATCRFPFPKLRYRQRAESPGWMAPNSSRDVEFCISRIRTLPRILHARAASMRCEASSGPAAPCDVISTSFIVPSALKVMGSMHAFRIFRLPWVER